MAAAALPILLELLQIGAHYLDSQKQAKALRERGRFYDALAERNASLAELQGADALRRGDFEGNRARGDARQAVGASRAALAAQGVDVDQGSAADVAGNERLLGEVDALTIKNNAALEAWGFNVEAANQRLQGKLSLLTGENEAAAARAQGYSTLLTGAANTYSLYQSTRTRMIAPGPRATSYPIPSTAGAERSAKGYTGRRSY